MTPDDFLMLKEESEDVKELCTLIGLYYEKKRIAQKAYEHARSDQNRENLMFCSAILLRACRKLEDLRAKELQPVA